MARRDLESGGGVTKNNSSAEKNYSPPQYSKVYNSETHRILWLVPMLVVANIAVFVITMYINNCPRNNLRFQGRCVARFLGRFSIQPMQENPLLGPSSSTLTKMGALRWDNVVNRHQGWRLVTCIWLHAGVIHLLANMLSLVFLGIHLEQQFGFIKIGIIYLVSGFGGSVLSTLFIRDLISVGASGALSGLLGAMLSELITNWTIYSNKAIALITLLVMIVINLGIGMLPYVDNFAHIGGFLVGLLLGFILLPRPQFGWLEQRRLPAGVRMKSKYKAYQYVLGAVSLILLIAGLWTALVMLFRGEKGYDHCHWCRYLTCAPTSKWECSNDNYLTCVPTFKWECSNDT